MVAAQLASEKAVSSGRISAADVGKMTFDAIREIDLNPVIVHPEGEGVLALDALMLVER